MLVHHCSNLNHWFDQLMWRDDIAQAQRRVQDLAHRACINHTPHIIQALQTREWGTGVPKARVVMDLKNIGVACSRKIDQSCPAGKTHGHAEWELVGRSYINNFG